MIKNSEFNLVKKIDGNAILVAQYFPPLNVIASNRALRMARVLLECFEFVYVITLPTDKLTENYIDEEFGKDVLCNPRLRIIYIAQILDGYGIATLPKYTHRFVGALLNRVLCSPGIDWVQSVAKVLLHVGDANPISIVVSTGGPFIPFLAVTKFCSDRNIPCILDYRDLWSQNPRAPYAQIFRYFVQRKIEYKVNSCASVITTVSDGCSNSILLGQPELNVRTLLNTPDEYYLIWFNQQSVESIKSKFKPSYLNIVLTGTVYQECTCKILLNAMKMLPLELSERIKFSYFGSSSNLIEIEFNEAGFHNNFTNFGYVNKSEAITAVRSADILLSLVYDKEINLETNSVLGIMTTKVFDYFLSGKPIINIGPSNADICILASNCGYTEFHNFDYTEINQLAVYLSSILRNLNVLRESISVAKLPDFANLFKEIITDVIAA